MKENQNVLIHIDRAKQEILAATSLVKVKDLWNKAEAVRQLGQVAKDPELITYATEVKLRAERRLGELLGDMKANGEITNAHKGFSGHGGGTTKLRHLDISKNMSSRAQLLSRVPEADFEAAVATAKAAEQELTRTSLATLLSRQQTSERIQKQVKRQATTPVGQYDVIVIDPPWPMTMIERDVRPNQAGVSYPVMTEDQLRALSIPVADHAHSHDPTLPRSVTQSLRPRGYDGR